MSTTPALRLKTRWFKPGEAKTPAEQAGAMAFIVFRVGRKMLERMRAAGFDVDPGPGYFDFLRETLAFLAAFADRLAYGRLEADARGEFTTALVRHLARHVEDSERDLVGTPEAGDRFIELFNAVVPEYAGFDTEADGRPDFACMRYFGSRLEPVLPAKDRPWVLDQVIAVEAPEAATLVMRSLNELLDPAPRRERRRSPSGE